MTRCTKQSFTCTSGCTYFFESFANVGTFHQSKGLESESGLGLKAVMEEQESTSMKLPEELMMNEIEQYCKITSFLVFFS